MIHRGLGEVHASDMLVKEASLSRRAITAKTVNEEVASLLASCQRIKRRLDAASTSDKVAKLEDLFRKQETKLHLAIAAMNAGRTYRHR